MCRYRIQWHSIYLESQIAVLTYPGCSSIAHTVLTFIYLFGVLLLQRKPVHTAGQVSVL